MSETTETSTTDQPAALADIEAGIERTRADLAHTVDQLTAKLDVKTRLRRRLGTAKDDAAQRWRLVRARATDESGKPTPVTMVVAGGVVAIASTVIVLMWRHDTSHHGR